jgi:hypothetical protein
MNKGDHPMNKELANQIANAYDQTLYHSKFLKTPRDNAQVMLRGRTHYVDDDTLRFFGCLIKSAQPSTFGLFYLITESLSLPTGGRGFRTVLFDLGGQVVYRPELAEMQNKTEKAEKAFYKWFETFDIETYYRDQIRERIIRTTRQAVRLEDALLALNVKEIA